jgi:hypothetical protein
MLVSVFQSDLPRLVCCILLVEEEDDS